MCDEKTLREIFAEFDKDKSGTIDKKELKGVLKQYYDAVKETRDDAAIEKEAGDIIKGLDTGGDGTISIDEFIKAFK